MTIEKARKIVSLRGQMEERSRFQAREQTRQPDEQRTSPASPGKAWDRVQISRHQDRPYTLDCFDRLFDSFREIHGDRKFADDRAIVGGMASFKGAPVMVLGHQKGRNTKERLERNYGMPKPEGYRKALRLMKLAEKFGRPVLTFIDTPGAYPGLGAEKRGQAEAIAYNLRSMAGLRVPIIATVLGEGGSGGALAVGLADRILMLENSIYSVISPESCSAILWKDQNHVREAAQSLKLTAPDLKRFGIVDEIVAEPPGGAHNDWDQTTSELSRALSRHLEEVSALDPQDRIDSRHEKFRKIGEYASRV
ncbi:MAG: acetyl-CoA carboxylase carboxyltransferase subunit alpha [Candidatus Aminicenantes bacterium]|nr:acetyl-CoA carboxylase carboxyltransferase subunit alpha [Candidatus Aminicenantes bacterium]